MSFKNLFQSWTGKHQKAISTVSNLEKREKSVRRKALFETMEPRLMFDADPIWVGGVYIEADKGSDLQGDSFYITFTGGAADTQLTQLIINLDQNAPGQSVADNIFDISDAGLGADHGFDFKVEKLVSRDNRAKVKATVLDGGMQLELKFENFYAGDRLVFSIDVDEIQHFDPSERNLEEINSGLDPITSGVEFQGSKFQASFVAPHYENIQGQSTYLNRYDSMIAPGNLELPADNENGLRDRSAGTAFSVTQLAKPISLAGTVYVDNNLNLRQESGDRGLAGVQLELFRKEGSRFVSTGYRTNTDSQGNYRFGTELKLKPGTYQIRETQPDGYFSVGAVPGRLNGSGQAGQTVANDKDLLTEISIPLGDLHVTDLDFAEAEPSKICGFVYVDANDNGLRDSNEQGIPNVEIRLEVIDAIANVESMTVRTDSDGSYCFIDLPPGVYRIVEVDQPSGFFDGQDSVGLVNGTPRGRNESNDELTEIRLHGNEEGVEYNFGELLPSSIAGRVIVDANGNCIIDDELDRPLPGVTVELIDENSEVIDTTVTDADGRYRFEGLRAGQYSIREVQPPDLLQGDAMIGNGGGEVAGPDDLVAIPIGSGVDLVEYNFCEIPPASLSGHVFEDENDDGFRQADEPLIPNATVTLYDADGNEVAQVQTNEAGFYRFSDLRPGNYRIVETQPDGYVDGKDSVGTIAGQSIGFVDSETDTFSEIVLGAGKHGIDYDFGELLPASIAGQVIVDSNGNCIVDAELDRPLPGVEIQLLDADGNVLQSTITDDDGRYRFEGLTPGIYSIREIQPDDLHQGDAMIGNGGGQAADSDNLIAIPIGSGDDLVDYNFCEIPPATISGFVFQDGARLITADGLPPATLRPIRDGMRDESDTPLGGIAIELRAYDGSLISRNEALPGIYTDQVITVTTDADGYFEFRGLKPGTYHIYQRQPVGFFDALDTAGTTGGFAINPEDAISDETVQQLLNALRSNSSTDPGKDAILAVTVLAGDFSEENNFSEILVGRRVAPPPPPPDPPPPLPPPPTPFIPPPVNGYVGPPFDRMLVAAPPAPYAPPLLIGGGGGGEYSWHLSVINAGTPRGSLAGRKLTQAQLAQAARVLDLANWTIVGQGPSQWSYVSQGSNNKWQTVKRQAFDVEGAIPLAGDFNGDGQDELALFLEGEWLIDVNGNGRWDDRDMWAKLGDKNDLPVIGDWDADGKDDIGIFGPEWDGDDLALDYEPGLPDPENRVVAKPKNVPPNPSQAPEHERMLQRSSNGPARADVIDHIFRFGARDDQPIAGDFNGDGVSSIGIFSSGKWRLDTNGDGRWTEGIDKSFDFGQAGDIAVVGDFDGDGIDEVAIIRGNQLIVDSNRNEKLDATDRVFELEADADEVVVGDFDGDGKDEPAAIQRGRRVTSDVTREARKAG
jgi:serine-aspartate repeat-containing protein C/D/E